MTSTFYKQLAPCAINGHAMRPPPVPTRASAPPVPRVTRSQAAPDHRLEHATQAAFLKALIAREDDEVSCQLRDSLAKTDHERKRICHAMLLMAALFMVSLAGLGYCALLLPQGVFHPARFVTISLSILGLASLIAQIEFSGYLLWHRIAVNRLHKECRRRVLLMAELTPPHQISRNEK